MVFFVVCLGLKDLPFTALCLEVGSDSHLRNMTCLGFSETTSLWPGKTHIVFVGCD